MAIGNSPGSQTKGTPFNLTINKTDLAANGAVSGDSYFNTSSNWKQIWVVYKSTTSNQMEVIKFDASESTPTRSVLFSTSARGTFEVKSVIIVDKHNGKKIVPRASLVTAEFDVDFIVPAFWTNYYNGAASSGGGQANKPTGSDITWASIAYKNTAFTGDFSISGQMKMDTSFSNTFLALGYRKTTLSSQSATLGDNFSSAIGISGGAVFHVAGADSSTSSGGSYSGTPSGGSTYNFSITRTGSSIVGIFNGQTMITDTYSGNLYILASIYRTNANTNAEIVSTALA